MSGYHSHWHQSLHDTSFGRPIRAPEIRVCRIPNLISPQLFVALAASDVDVKIFENNLVACLNNLEHTVTYLNYKVYPVSSRIIPYDPVSRIPVLINIVHLLYMVYTV